MCSNASGDESSDSIKNGANSVPRKKLRAIIEGGANSEPRKRLRAIVEETQIVETTTVPQLPACHQKQQPAFSQMQHTLKLKSSPQKRGRPRKDEGQANEASTDNCKSNALPDPIAFSHRSRGRPPNSNKSAAFTSASFTHINQLEKTIDPAIRSKSLEIYDMLLNLHQKNTIRQYQKALIDWMVRTMKLW